MLLAHCVSFMEDGLRWHHSVPTKEEFERAKKELKEKELKEDL